MEIFLVRRCVLDRMVYTSELRSDVPRTCVDGFLVAVVL